MHDKKTRKMRVFKRKKGNLQIFKLVKFIVNRNSDFLILISKPYFDKYFNLFPVILTLILAKKIASQNNSDRIPKISIFVNYE